MRDSKWNRRNRKHARRSALLLAALLAGLLPVRAGVAWAQSPNPNSKLCFIDVIGVPGPFFRRPPVIDGCLRECSYPSDSPAQHDDFGWQSAFQFVANPVNSGDTPTGDVIAQGIYDPSGTGKLDLSFEVKNDPRLDENDAVVIAIQGTVANKTGNYALLVIFPFLNHGGSAYNGPIGGQVGLIQHFAGVAPARASAVTWDLNSDTNPSWVKAAVTSGGSGTNWAWTVEVQLQRGDFEGGGGGIALAGAGFALFFDVIRIFDQNHSQGFDMPWPPAATPGTAGSPTPPTPDLAQWGTASINQGVCGGVSFQPGDIKTNQANPNLINTNPANPNRFSVSLQNTLIDTRPGPNHNKPMAAKAVTAKFRIANFGLPSDLAWAPIPEGNDISNTADVPAATTSPANSAVPPGVIGAPGTITLQTKAPGWVPDATSTSGNTHQCILAELSSPSSDVVFVNKSAYQNIAYGHNPGFEPEAIIDGRWGAPPAGKSSHTIDLLRVRSYQYAYGDGTVDGIATGKLTAQVSLTFLGFRHTGRFVTLQNHKVELSTSVGYYGYVVQHELGDDFAAPFAKRHDHQVNSAPDVSGKQKWVRVNKALLQDPEKPTEVDWNLDFPDLKPVPGTDGAVFRVEVPRDTVSKVKGTMRYAAGNSPPPPPSSSPVGCCPAPSGAGTTPKVSTLGLVVLVGAILGRRRRRR